MTSFLISSKVEPHSSVPKLRSTNETGNALLVRYQVPDEGPIECLIKPSVTRDLQRSGAGPSRESCGSGRKMKTTPACQPSGVESCTSCTWSLFCEGDSDDQLGFGLVSSRFLGHFSLLAA